MIEARKLEHQYPHALKIEYRDPSTNPPKPMFQLSGVHCRPPHHLHMSGLGGRGISVRGFGSHGVFKFRVPHLGSYGALLNFFGTSRQQMAAGRAFRSS